jgi:hypothetical protein
MKRSNGFKAALLGSAVGLLSLAGTSYALPIVNPSWELPPDLTDSTSTTATGWTMSPAVGDAYTNPGQRCVFANNTPGGTWSFWLQTFVQQGNATQAVAGVVPGTNYNFTTQFAFEVPGYNNITLANQAADSASQDTGDCYSYVSMQYEDALGNAIGPVDITKITAGSVTTANHVFSPYSVTGVAPAGAAQVLLAIGWQNGGLDGNTGGQSAFADDSTLTVTVPEPASLSMLALGGLSLLSRRRRGEST